MFVFASTCFRLTWSHRESSCLYVKCLSEEAHNLFFFFLSVIPKTFLKRFLQPLFIKRTPVAELKSVLYSCHFASVSCFQRCQTCQGVQVLVKCWMGCRACCHFIPFRKSDNSTRNIGSKSRLKMYNRYSRSWREVGRRYEQETLRVQKGSHPRPGDIRDCDYKSFPFWFIMYL